MEPAQDVVSITPQSIVWKIDPCSKSYPDQDVDELLPQSIDPSSKSFIAQSRSDWLSQGDWEAQGCPGVRCGQVLEIIQAKIDTNSLRQSRVPIEVYGEITIIQSGSELEVYYCDDRPQLLYPTEEGRLLQLTGPDENVAMVDPDIRVDIRNKATDAVIVKGSESFDMTTSKIISDLERVSNLRFNAPTGDVALVEDGGSLEIEYAALTYGVYALIEVSLFSEEDTEESGLEVYGDITVECELLSSPMRYKTYLLHLAKEEHEWMEFENPIVLSKRLVGVPAYSHLRISVRLKNNENDKVIVWSEYLFKANNYRRWKDIGRGDGNGFYALVDVCWCEPPGLNEPSDVDYVGYGLSVPGAPSLMAQPLLEVYSIYIHVPPMDHQEVELYGSVEIFDRVGFCNLFRLSKEEAHRLPSGFKSLPLKGPDRASTLGDRFAVVLNLDNVDDNVHIKGCMNSSHGLNEEQMHWFDKFLSAVVMGTDDRPFAARPFAAIHYSVFSYAVVAKVSIHFVLNSLAQASFEIYGYITVFYDKFEYSTDHETEHFRKKLFERNDQNAVESVENIPLSRDLVAVPMDSSLLFDVNLSFLGNQGLQQRQHITGTVKFGIGEESQVIKEESVEVYINVKWISTCGKNSCNL